MVLAYLLWTPLVVRIVNAISAIMPSALQKKLVYQVEMGAQGLQALRSPILIGKIVASTVIQWSFICLCVYLSLEAFAIQVPPSAVFLTLAFVVLLTSIVPSAPGFFGSIQLAYALALDPYDVDPATAFAASIFYHSLMYFSVFLIGLVSLRGLGYRLKSLQTEVQKSGDIQLSADSDP